MNTDNVSDINQCADQMIKVRLYSDSTEEDDHSQLVFAVFQLPQAKTDRRLYDAPYINGKVVRFLFADSFDVFQCNLNFSDVFIVSI